MQIKQSSRMNEPKLKHVLSIVSRNLADKAVPHALIGAMAMALYGIPRYTSDIDLITDERDRETIKRVMTQLGYNCGQDDDGFAQFDSELGVYGKVDFLFVRTDEGRAILKQKVIIADDVLGAMPVVQPTDFIVLKLMAIANNPERTAHDISDIQTLLRAADVGLLLPSFEPINNERINKYAERFGVSTQLSTLLTLIAATNERP